VDIDNVQTAYDLTEKLIADGAKQIIFMSGALNTTARKRRFEGYQAALEKNGIAFDERLVICHSTPTYLSEEAANAQPSTRLANWMLMPYSSTITP
jgi:DNA-binding LacI/PurR family transcriptional regulator